MIRYRLENFPKGYIVGGCFDPKILDNNIEIAIQEHEAGHIHECHFHKESVEVNVVLDGKCSFYFPIGEFKVDLIKNDIIHVDRNEPVEFVAETDCRMLVIKTSSIKGDRYLWPKEKHLIEQRI